MGPSARFHGIAAAVRGRWPPVRFPEWRPTRRHGNERRTHAFANASKRYWSVSGAVARFVGCQWSALICDQAHGPFSGQILLLPAGRWVLAPVEEQRRMT